MASVSCLKGSDLAAKPFIALIFRTRMILFENQEHLAVRVLGSFIAHVAKASISEEIPASGWTFIPIEHGS